jgi:hypothetical protein
VEYSEPELERTARRLRRVVFAIRVVFYSGAVVLALVLLPLALPGGAVAEETWLEGTTSQGEGFELRIDPDGQPGRLATNVKAKCGDGRPYWLAWWPYGPFRLEGETLTVRDTRTHSYSGRTWHRTVTLRARVTDDSVSGTMEAVEQLDDPSYGPYSCESGPVTFLARAR